MAGERVRTRSVGRDRLSRRNAQLVGLAGFLFALALPVMLWHRAFRLIAADFRLEVNYLVSGWTGYTLIAAGLAFLFPVLLSVGRDPESRLYPRSREAYAGWGVTLYLLGLVLAAQVAQITDGLTSP